MSLLVSSPSGIGEGVTVVLSTLVAFARDSLSAFKKVESFNLFFGRLLSRYLVPSFWQAWTTHLACVASCPCRWGCQPTGGRWCRSCWPRCSCTFYARWSRRPHTVSLVDRARREGNHSGHTMWSGGKCERQNGVARRFWTGYSEAERMKNDESLSLSRAISRSFWITSSASDFLTPWHFVVMNSWQRLWTTQTQIWHW